MNRCRVRGRGFTGSENERTNALSAWLMDLAGPPWGAYGPAERCGFCGTPLNTSSRVAAWRKILAKVGLVISQDQIRLSSPRPIWLHTLFEKIA